MTGPANFIKQESEQVLKSATDMIKLPPNSYCIIKNPVVRKPDGSLATTEFGEVQVRFEEIEIRRQEDYPDPFPLYPYEQLYKEVSPYLFLKDNEAVVLRAVREFFDDRFGSEKIQRFIEDEYMFTGPGTYLPRV